MFVTKLIKQLLNFIKSLYFTCWGEEGGGGKTANHVNFMLPMLISCSFYFCSLKGDISKVSNILTSGNWF